MMEHKSKLTHQKNLNQNSTAPFSHHASFLSKSLLLTVVFFSFFNLYSQNEKNFWIFGRVNQGVTNSVPNVLNFENMTGGIPSNDFINTSQTTNGGNPIPAIDNSSFLGVEGCAVATHPATGDLMFYTDGDRVYDDQHNLIQSGFGGHSSGTQSTAICYNPSDCNYYIFSNGTGQGAGGVLQYATYTYPGGASSFSPQSNMPGNIITSEGMLVIPSSVDPGVFYLVVHLNGNNSFRVYTVDDTGTFPYQDFDMGPVFNTSHVSNFVYNETSETFAFSFQIVDGSTWNPDQVYTADFNPIDGTFDVSSILTIQTLATNNGAAKPVNIYDLEFSPNGEILYYTASRYIFTTTSTHPWFLALNEDQCGLYHHNLNTGVATQISNFSFTGMETNGRMFGLKLGPDNKIYTITEAMHDVSPVVNLKTTIGVINNPNSTIPSTINFDPDIYQNADVMAYKFPEFVVTPNFQFETTYYEFSDSCGNQYAVIGLDTNTLISNSPINQNDVFWTFDGAPLLDVNNNPITGFPITVTEPGEYQMTIMVGNCPFVADNITDLSFKSCCYMQEIANDNNYILFDDPNVNYIIDETTVWDHKIIIADDIIVTITGQNVILDVTTADVIFGECAGINFEGGATLRSTNTVWRPCNIDGTWRGLYFDGQADYDHIINECTFKNAVTALFFDGGDGVVSNSLFSNCNTSIEVTRTKFDHPISGNHFLIDQFYPDFVPCGGLFNGQSEWIGMDIRSSSTMNGNISQNDFTNGRVSKTDIESIGIDVNSSKVNISNNQITDVAYAIQVNGNRGRFTYQILNNFIEYANQTTADARGIFISDATAIGQVFGNDVTASLTNYFDMHGIELSNVHNNYIQSNYIHGFDIGIVERSLQLVGTYNKISDNTLENATTGSIRVDVKAEGNNRDISCNVINNDFNTKYGIFVNRINSKSQIFSNCIFDNRRAIILRAQEDQTLPIIRNNFLYNYTRDGIQNRDYSGSIGTNQEPGMNTFWSNDNSAIDINSLVPITVANNFGMFNISANVQITQNNPDHSTASCANQIYNMPSQGNLDPSLICNGYFESALTIIDDVFYLKANWKQIFVELSDLKKIQIAETFNEVQDENLDIEDAYNFIEANSTINHDRLMFSKAIMYFNRALYSQAGNALSSVNIPELSLEKSLWSIWIEARSNNELNAFNEQELWSRIQESTLAEGILNEYGQRNVYTGATENETIEDFNSAVITLNENSLKVYPNPATNTVFIDLVNLLDESTNVKILDLKGKILNEWMPQNTTEKFQMDVSHLAKGMYIINVTIGAKSFNSKLVKE